MDILLQVVALDDVVCLLVFSVAASVADAAECGVFSPAKIAVPILLNIASILVA